MASGITFESGGTVNNLTVNLGPNTTLGTVGGQSLTLGPNVLVELNDPNFAFPAVVGREFTDGNGGLVSLTNQGTIRSTFGELYVGRFFDTGNNPSNVDVTNAGLMESRFALTIHANNFTNAAGGVVRAMNGGGVFLFGRNSWVNQRSRLRQAAPRLRLLLHSFTHGTGPAALCRLDGQPVRLGPERPTGTSCWETRSPTAAGHRARSRADGAVAGYPAYPGTTPPDGVPGRGCQLSRHRRKGRRCATLTAATPFGRRHSGTTSRRTVDATFVPSRACALQVFDNNLLTLGSKSIGKTAWTVTQRRTVFPDIRTDTAMVTLGLVHVEQGHLVHGTRRSRSSTAASA